MNSDDDDCDDDDGDCRGKRSKTLKNRRRKPKSYSSAAEMLRATLLKILISNFHPEIDFAHNSSINFTWQVGDKHEIISEKLDFFKIF